MARKCIRSPTIDNFQVHIVSILQNILIFHYHYNETRNYELNILQLVYTSSESLTIFPT